MNVFFKFLHDIERNHKAKIWIIRNTRPSRLHFFASLHNSHYYTTIRRLVAEQISAEPV